MSEYKDIFHPFHEEVHLRITSKWTTFLSGLFWLVHLEKFHCKCILLPAVLAWPEYWGIKTPVMDCSGYKLLYPSQVGALMLSTLTLIVDTCVGLNGPVEFCSLDLKLHMDVEIQYFKISLDIYSRRG